MAHFNIEYIKKKKKNCCAFVVVCILVIHVLPIIHFPFLHATYQSTRKPSVCQTKPPNFVTLPDCMQGFFLVSSGAEIRPLSQWDLGNFFPNLKKKNPNLKKKKKKKIFFFFFFFFRIFIQSPHTQAAW